MVIYFTGTGNSRYIAELIAERLNDGITDATKLIKEERHPNLYSEKPYVFVAPTYAWRLPRVFKEWIEKCKFDGNKKAYFALTCGDAIGAAGSYIEKLATRIGLAYMGTAQVVMPENYIIMFPATTEEENRVVISEAALYTAELCDRVALESAFDPVRIKLIGRLESGIVNSSFYTFYIGAKKFYATNACISCGKCSESCMMNNIRLKDGKPVWGNACTHCMACIGKCPTAAIEYGKNTKGKRRYLFPQA